jgi:predicted nucleic acid-binding protein
LETLPYSKIVKTSFKFGRDICSDKDDLKFLELAVSVQADYVVSGDKDLLKLKEVEGIKILSPAEFLALLERS